MQPLLSIMRQHAALPDQQKTSLLPIENKIKGDKCD